MIIREHSQDYDYYNAYTDDIRITYHHYHYYYHND